MPPRIDHDPARLTPPLRGALVLFASLLVAAFAGLRAGGDEVARAQPEGPVPSPLVAARPYGTQVSSHYDEARLAPLVLFLHGYGDTADLAARTGLDRIVEEEGGIGLSPSGTVDRVGRRFWNGASGCCDLFRTGVDDVAYLSAVLDDAMARYRIDPRRVFVVGYSNGAFMAHRLACERATRITGIVAISGTNWLDVDRCDPAARISVLQVHGDADQTVGFLGGSIFGLMRYPGATAATEEWARLNECEGGVESLGALDLVGRIEGRETAVERRAACNGGVTAWLWTVRGGGHELAYGAEFARLAWAYLQAGLRA